MEPNRYRNATLTAEGGLLIPISMLSRLWAVDIPCPRGAIPGPFGPQAVMAFVGQTFSQS